MEKYTQSKHSLNCARIIIEIRISKEMPGAVAFVGEKGNLEMQTVDCKRQLIKVQNATCFDTLRTSSEKERWKKVCGKKGDHAENPLLRFWKRETVFKLPETKIWGLVIGTLDNAIA